MRFFPPRKAVADSEHLRSIKLKLRDVNPLFNSMDPSPYIERDLDANAEEFIFGWAQEFPPGTPIRRRINLEQWPAEDPKELIRQAVHNHFARRAQLTELEFQRLMKQGRTSLPIGCPAATAEALILDAPASLATAKGAAQIPHGRESGGR